MFQEALAFSSSLKDGSDGVSRSSSSAPGIVAGCSSSARDRDVNGRDKVSVAVLSGDLDGVRFEVN